MLISMLKRNVYVTKIIYTCIKHKSFWLTFVHARVGELHTLIINHYYLYTFFKNKIFAIILVSTVRINKFFLKLKFYNKNYYCVQ